MIRQADDAPLPQDLGHGTFHRLVRLLVEDVKHRLQRLPLGLGLAPAGEFLGHRVHPAYLAVGIGGDDAVADGVERRGQLPPAGPQRGVAADYHHPQAGDHAYQERFHEEGLLAPSLENSQPDGVILQEGHNPPDHRRRKGLIAEHDHQQPGDPIPNQATHATEKTFVNEADDQQSRKRI